MSDDPTLRDGEPPTRLRREDTLGHGTMIGRYMVLRMIGRGGMGAVYAAHDPKLDRQLALKLLHSTRGDAPERLVREAQALARLSDPHVVTVYDAGELDGQVFIAMQLVDGEDLASALGTRKPTTARILDWFAQAGRGLAAAHAAGLVHRDFKPSNVLIDRHDHVAVTDFGLVRTVAYDPRGLTGLGDLMGTPAFMSPEQHNLQPATPASDQFSFCVSLWDALFGKHPFVDGDRGAMSPFEIGYLIFDGTLIPPPRGTRVPRRVIDALTRGLARDPAERWPTMDALIVELAPERVRRIWPFVVAGVAAAAIGGTAVGLVTRRAPDGASCASEVDARAASAWSPAAGSLVRERFGKSGRSYAAAAASQVTASIDRYTTRWRDLAADVCAGERAGRGAASDLIVRRRACLDGRLDALRGVAHLLATEDRPEFVDHAQAIADGLPELDDCNDPASLLAAPGTPPAAQAAAVATLESDLALAIARSNGGDPQARGELEAIVARADALAWASLQVRADLALGERKLGSYESGSAELTRAAERAMVHHLDREGARAWAGAVVSAGLDRKPDQVALLGRLATATAARIGDRHLIVDADIARGRALARLGQYQEASTICKAALTMAQTLDGATSRDRARDCLVETLAPLGAFAELEPMLDQIIVDESKLLGDDHPRIADYLSVRATLGLRRGQVAEARADTERLLAIRRRVFPPRHFKMAEALQNLGQVTLTEGKVAEAKQLYEEALAIASETTPAPLMLLGSLHTILGFIAQQVDHDQAAALRHFEEAIRLTRQRAGDDSLELGVLLGNYGQIKAADDVDAGLAILDEARAILDHLQDKRGILIATAMAEIEVAHGRWSSARRHAEEMLSSADGDADPVNFALAQWCLAQALVETRGDRLRARTLATEARASYAKLGPASAPDVAKIDAWLKTH